MRQPIAGLEHVYVDVIVYVARDIHSPMETIIFVVQNIGHLCGLHYLFIFIFFIILFLFESKLNTLIIFGVELS